MARVKMPAPFTMGRVRVRVEKRRSPEPDEKGQWYWRAELNEDKQRRAVWCGWATKAEAELIVADLVLKGLPETKKKRKDDEAPVVVADLMDIWVEHIEADPDLSESTKDAYRCAAERLCFDKRGSSDEEDWTARPIAGVKLTALTEKVVEEHKRRRLKQGAAPLSLKLEIDKLYAALEWGRRYGHTEAQVPRVEMEAETVRPKPTPEAPELALIYEQIQKMRRGKAFRQDWPVMCFLLVHGTGARIHEIANLAPTDVTWEPDGCARLRIRISKTGPREVIITEPILLAELKQWMERPPSPLRYKGDDSYLLGVKPKTVRTCYRERYLKRACRGVNDRDDIDVEIPVYTPHAQRRHVSRELMRGNCDDMTFKAVLGQSKRTAERDYTEAQDEDRRKAAKLMGRLPGQVLPFPEAATAKGGAHR